MQSYLIFPWMPPNGMRCGQGNYPGGHNEKQLPDQFIMFTVTFDDTKIPAMVSWPLHTKPGTVSNETFRPPTGCRYNF